MVSIDDRRTAAGTALAAGGATAALVLGNAFVLLEFRLGPDAGAGDIGLVAGLLVLVGAVPAYLFLIRRVVVPLVLLCCVLAYSLSDNLGASMEDFTGFLLSPYVLVVFVLLPLLVVGVVEATARSLLRTGGTGRE